MSDIIEPEVVDSGHLPALAQGDDLALDVHPGLGYLPGDLI